MKTYKKPLFSFSEIEESQLLCLEANGSDPGFDGDGNGDGSGGFSDLKKLGL